LYNFIKEINNNEIAISIFEDMDRTITGKGEFWLVYNEYILSDKQLVEICDNRIKAMVKLLPGSIDFERNYLLPMIKYFNECKKLAGS
jgi:hypothetical protein|tara:strand:+ start:370 stop:633 length:264 start_codon:yes stop_codon:yes gene_type:complete